jgi:hypothetical protein
MRSHGKDFLGEIDIKEYTETVNILGTLSSTPVDIDLNEGNIVSATCATDITFTFSNPPVSGKCGSFIFVITNGGSVSITWPVSVAWAGGTEPTLTTSGTDILTFFTIDGGTIWYGVECGLDMS